MERPLVKVSDLNMSLIDTTIKTKGFISKLAKNNEDHSHSLFYIQDIDYKQAKFPGKMICEYTGEAELKNGNFVEFQADFIIKNIDKRKTTPCLIIDPSTLIIIEINPIEITVSENDSFFNEDNLRSLIFKSEVAVGETLSVKAYEEGFHLVKENGFKNHNSVKYRCYMHSNMKGMECNFGFNVSKTTDSSENTIYRIPLKKNYCLTHNHELLKEQFSHKVLGQEIVDEITILSDSGIKPMKIASVIKAKYKIELATQQICRITGKGNEDGGTRELIEYMDLISGVHHELNESKDGKLYRVAVATFTEKEIRILAKYGDVVVIDPTFGVLRNEWPIIPLTVIRAKRELLSGGVFFFSTTNHEFFEWMLNILNSNILPISSSLETIISDDDRGLGGSFLLNDHNLKRIICYWHKKSDSQRNYQSFT